VTRTDYFGALVLACLVSGMSLIFGLALGAAMKAEQMLQHMPSEEIAFRGAVGAACFWCVTVAVSAIVLSAGRAAAKRIK
jgi:hypothetical protein